MGSGEEFGLRLFVFGYGFSARALMRRLGPVGWTAAATFRDPSTEAGLRAEGVDPVALEDREGLARELAGAQAVLITAPPGPSGCPALPVLVPALAQGGAFPDWIGYLSTTGVYGDRHGGWVFEDSRLAAQSVEGARRVTAERDWLEVGRGMGPSRSIGCPAYMGPAARRWTGCARARRGG
jgi:hypothetical protein